MMKRLEMLSAIMLVTVAVIGPATALDNGGGGTGGVSACKTCSRTFLPFQGVYTAQCSTANILFGSGYRGCVVTTSYPAGNQDCSMSNWGSCAPDSGGGGGGFIP